MHVSHIILRVTDMDRSVAFYRDAVGLEVTATEIVIEVDDVLATFRDMSAREVPFEVEPRAVTADGSKELHAAHFHDPDGHLWSITGWI